LIKWGYRKVIIISNSHVILKVPKLILGGKLDLREMGFDLQPKRFFTTQGKNP